MPRRRIEIGGEEWTVTSTGRVTQYSRDEFGLLFARGSGPGRERRVMRFSPMGSRSPEAALDQLTAEQLRSYFTMSQPAWTAPETGYRR
ncbi:MAG: hypothetical protein ABI613_10110 [Gemmatimonadota bacterium]